MRSVTEESESDKTAIAPKTLLTGLPSRTERTALMVISDSCREIRVYDKDAPEPERLYTLKKLTNGG